MSKHTPGPWRYVTAAKFDEGSIEHGIGSLYGPDVLIYTTPCEPGLLWETYERQAADGRLCAAAPEMYDVIVALGHNEVFEDSALAGAARALLAKIEGEVTRGQA